MRDFLAGYRSDDDRSSVVDCEYAPVGDVGRDARVDSVRIVPGADTVGRAQYFLSRVASTLAAKNLAYGDSAANPVRIFSRADSSEAIKVRIDDKLSRIARGSEFLETEDVILDLVGYLALLVAVREGK